MDSRAQCTARHGCVHHAQGLHHTGSQDHSKPAELSDQVRTTGMCVLHAHKAGMDVICAAAQLSHYLTFSPEIPNVANALHINATHAGCTVHTLIPGRA